MASDKNADSESSNLVKMFENLSLEDSNSISTISVFSQTAQSFRALGKIVHFLRKRYQSGLGVQSFTLDEILEETKQTNLSPKIRQWLVKEALCKNKRIGVSEDKIYYQFKPAFKLQNIDDLIELLKENERKGLGGILMDDIRDSLPNYRQALKDCDSRILVFKRPLDRKSIVYYVDNETPPATDLELQAMWRSLGLEDIEEVYEPSDDNGRN